jgi:hypothetical protein
MTQPKASMGLARTRAPSAATYRSARDYRRCYRERPARPYSFSEGAANRGLYDRP